MKYRLVTVEIKSGEVEIPDGCIPIWIGPDIVLAPGNIDRPKILTYLEPIT